MLANYEMLYIKECNGVLINRRTVLTAASCIVNSFPSFSPSGYNNDTIEIKKEYSPLYSEWESHYEIYFKVYLDLQSNYQKNIYPTEQHPVKEIIMV